MVLPPGDHGVINGRAVDVIKCFVIQMFKYVSTSQQVRTYNPKGQKIVAAVNTDVKQHIDEGKTVSRVNRD